MSRQSANSYGTPLEGVRQPHLQRRGALLMSFQCLSIYYARISRHLLPNQQNSFPLLNGSRVLTESCWASMVEAFHPCEKMRIQYARDSLFEVNINASVISHMQNCSISKSTADYPVADRINCTLISSWNLTDLMVVCAATMCQWRGQLFIECLFLA